MELLRVAAGLREWEPATKQTLTVDNVDTAAKVISITIRRPVFTSEPVPVHVNILFQDETPPSRTPSVVLTPQSKLQQHPPLTPSSKKLTLFPTFEIVRSGLIPMAQRQNLASRLQTLTIFLVAKRIPTFEPCMRFLAYDDPNAGIDPGQVGFVGGVDGLLSNSGSTNVVVAPGGSGNSILGRNTSSLFGGGVGNSLEEDGSRGSRIGEMKNLSLGDDGISPRGLRIVAGVSPLGAERLPATDGLKVGSMNSNDMQDAGFSSDDSDERLDVGGRGGYRHLKERRLMKESGPTSGSGANVPFPRLCGASFSMSGHLVCFFSPLPHPTKVKYATYSLSTRRQQPLFQTQQLTTYPRNYVAFEHFRNFLVQKATAGSTASLSNQKTGVAASALVQSAANRTFAGLLGQNREDWVGDDEVDGETSLQNLFMNQTRQGGANMNGIDGQYVSTSELLIKLRSHGIVSAVPRSDAVLSDMMDAVAERTTAIQQQQYKSEKFRLTPDEVSSLSRSRNNSLPKLYEGREGGPAVIAAPFGRSVANSPHGRAVSDPASQSSTPNASRVSPHRKASIFTVGSEERLNELDDQSSSTISALGSSTDLLSPLSQRRVSSNRSSRTRAKSVQVDSFLGGASFESEGSSPRDRIMYPVPVRRGSSTSSGGTPTSSYTSSVKNRNANAMGSWKSGTETKSNHAHGGLVGRPQDSGKNGIGIIVFVKDVRDTMPVSEKLAREYTLTGTDPVAICSENSAVASRNNRADLAKLWTIAGLIIGRVSGLPTQEDDETFDDDESEYSEDHVGPRATILSGPCTTTFGAKRRASMALIERLASDPRGAKLHSKDKLELKKDGTFAVKNIVVKDRESYVWLRADWANHPLGRGLVDKILSYLERIGDVQTLALLSCVLSEPFGCTNFDDVADHNVPIISPKRYTNPPPSLPSTFSDRSIIEQSPQRRPLKRSSVPNAALLFGRSVESEQISQHEPQ
ncbi:hypothetical protein BCR33DRAFT_466067 [Rhizoclosmatium globosum]|uniref:Uncharacterized protein n=1 Tax=Rhizoclosmatium globosum TaxID=329046 RepID=A0A1Y2BR49_9FUNG|nr:hypothetical protein BCR33DRAFT_466067 [Rhizoclosmatium globosum]|eukprot:ORY37221.1 hypothetical protein BCR33DRAFT_466067 [Rhizoclosmatium globosum]